MNFEIIIAILVTIAALIVFASLLMLVESVNYTLKHTTGADED